MTNIVKGKAIVDFEKIIEQVYTAALKDASDEQPDIEEIEQESYQRGMEDAFDSPQMEKYNAGYVVEQFANCKTLEDFTEKLKEITNRSFNFMQ